MPEMKKTSEAETNGMMYLRSRALSPGVMKRHSCQKRTGEASSSPPKKAILMRSVSPSSGAVTRNVQPLWAALRAAQ